MATPALRIRIAPKFPAKVQGSGGITVTRTGGVYTIGGAGVRPPATTEEAIEGIDDFKTMTPEKVKDAITVRLVTPEDYGGLQAAIDESRNVAGRPGSSYSLTGITLGNSKSFDGNGSLVSATTGDYIFTLSGYNSSLEQVYLSDNAASNSGAIKVSTGRYCYVEDIVSPNTGAAGIVFRDDAGTGVALSYITSCIFDGVTGHGVDLGSSVSEVKTIDLHVYGKIDYVAGLGKPRAGSVGWYQNTPVVGSLAVGGHQTANSNFGSLQYGKRYISAQLTLNTGDVIDSCSNWGLSFTDSQNMMNVGSFVGSTRGINVDGNSKVFFSSLTTILNGTIPPWGQNPGFYDGTAVDMQVKDTSTVIVDVASWRGDKRMSVDPTAKLILPGAEAFRWRSGGTVAAGSTVYLTEAGQFANEADAVWRMPFDGQLLLHQAFCAAAPGSGQTFTYNLRKNAATVLTITISDTGVFKGKIYGPISIVEGDSITLQLVTSAGAAAARHQGNILGSAN